MSDTTKEIPEGWQLVPVKPTMEMIKNAAGDHEGENWLPHSLWASMLAAAPSAPAVWQPDAGAQWYLERIRQEISAGRKQNALAYLSFAFADITRRQEWQPIATAPRDGTKVLLCLTGYQPVVGYFDGENWEYQDCGDFAEEDHWFAWQERTGEWFPDNWMPLPAPPAVGRQA